jgi:ankyrin repeat protein
MTTVQKTEILDQPIWNSRSGLIEIERAIVNVNDAGSSKATFRKFNAENKVQMLAAPRQLNEINQAIEIEDWGKVERLISEGIGLNELELIKTVNQSWIASAPIRLAHKACQIFNGPEETRKKCLYLLNKMIHRADLNIKYNPCAQDVPGHPYVCTTTIGESLLIYSITSDQYDKEWLEITKSLLSQNVSPNGEYGRSKWHPVQFAVQIPELGKIKLLLKYGAVVSGVDCFSWMGFAKNPDGSYDTNSTKNIIALLMRHGANPDQQSSRNPKISQKKQFIEHTMATSPGAFSEQQLLDLFSYSSQQTLTDQFASGELEEKIQRKEIDPNTLIHKAILENSPEVIRFLLKQGVDVDYPDENGMTPLTISILNRCNYAVETLLQNGADTNPSVKWCGKNLAELALDMNDTNSIHALIRYGIDPNIKVGASGFLTACLRKIGASEVQSSEWTSFAKELINKGAALHPSNEDCPVMYAVQAASLSKDYSVLNLMLQKNADLNAAVNFKGKEYETPLMWAARSGTLDIVKFLVESGADVNKSIKYGKFDELIKTPIKEALARGNRPEIVQYLLQHGAKA